MAAAAGVAAVAVSWGAHRREALDACAPAARVDDVAALRAWLAEHT
jgi:phosphoglycolate phosphatase-like HAD superfamily hydrolase